MSDARAKAEARRAKILARDSSKRTIEAIVAPEDDDALYANLGEVKGKERPIAARRNLIRSVSQVDVDEVVDGASVPATPKDKSDNNGEETNETPAKAEEKPEETKADVNAESNQSTIAENPTESGTEKKVVEATPVKEAVSAPAISSSSSSKTDKDATKSEEAQNTGIVSPKSSSSVKLPPPKSLEEIEREVAENTAKFDRTMSFRSNSKLTPDRLKQLEQLAQRKNTYSVDPSNIMRLVRLLVIGLLAAYTGYRTAEVSRLEALQPSKLSEIQTVKEFDEFGNVVAEVPVARGDEPVKVDPAAGRTWVGYFQDQYTRRSECTITAVMLAWWIAGLFKRFISTSQKQQKSKVNIIEQLYNYVNGFQEAALSTVGEFGWHLFVLIFSVACHSLYYGNLALQQSAAASKNPENFQPVCTANDASCMAGVGEL